MKRPTPLLIAICSSGLAGSFRIQLGDVSDLDPPGLHAFRHASDQVDMEQPVFEGGVLDLDVIGEIETPLESPGRNSLVKVLGLLVVGLLAGHRKLACLGRYSDVLRSRPRQGQVNLERILILQLLAVEKSEELGRLTPI